MLMWGIALYPYQRTFIEELTTDSTGIETIEAVSQIPRTSSEAPVLMIPWSPRYFAASYSRLVTGENRDLRMVDHNANLLKLTVDGKTLYTIPETFYGYPPEWWSELLSSIYLTSAAPGVIR